MCSIEAAERLTDRYPINGFAPGNYFCVCHSCEQQFTGDKRALTCETCALDKLVTAAKLFARDRHMDQDYDGQPYVDGHVAKVVEVLKQFGMDGFYLAAGWLHDVIEDTETSREEVREKFGDRVALLVWACTGIGENRRVRNADIYGKITAYPEAAIVKVADRIANVEASGPDSRHRQMYLKERDRFAEVVAVHVPRGMAERLEGAYTSR